MTEAASDAAGGGGLLGTLVLGLAAVVLGLVGGLPFALGALIGVVGVGASVAFRTVASRPWRAWTVVPAMLAVSVEVVLAPAVPAAELVAGATGIAFLFWMADDPHGSRGRAERGLIPIAVVAVAVGFSLGIVLALPRFPSEVGIAGGLLALAMVLVAILLARSRFDAARGTRVDAPPLAPTRSTDEMGSTAPSED